MSEILRTYSADFVRQYPQQAIPHVQSTLAKIALCRTAALGTHHYYCPGCGTHATVHNSCGASQCPACSGGKRSAWLDSTSKLLLEGVTYFQVVFTIPDKLSSLTLGNRREMFRLLFHAAWESLRDVIAHEQGFEAAAAMVLHTWNQMLDAHVHVHALVPGGGPSLKGQPRWISSRRRCGPRLPGAYLVDANVLRARFRETFLTGLTKLHTSGNLKLTGEWSHLQDATTFETFLKPLWKVEWVTYIQAPPVIEKSGIGQESSTETVAAPPEHVVKYLACYMSGGPISSMRILSHQNGQVTFLARSGTETGGTREQVPVTMDGVEFVRRWCLHIQPQGFVKTRRFGGFSNHHCQRYLTECREHLLNSTALVETPPEPFSATDPATVTDTADAPDVDSRAPECSTCGKHMLLFTRDFRPSWRAIMCSPARPKWYADG